MTTTTIGRGVTLTTPIEPVTLSLDDFLAGKYKLTRENLTTRSKMLIGRLENYIESMKSNAINTEANIVKQQGVFLQTLLGILDSDPMDARLCWDVLLFLANKYQHELFNDRLACRLFNRLPLDNQQLFLTLMTLVVGTCNSRFRVLHLKRTPIQSVTKLLQTPLQKTNLTSYYASSIE